MAILQAQIQTERASRYLVQFCKHAAAMGRGGHTARMHLQAPMAHGKLQVSAEWSDTTGTVTFNPGGRCTLAAEDGMLTLLIDAPTEDGAAEIRDVITRDLERFTRRDPVTVIWQRSETSGAAPFRATDATTTEQGRGLPRPNLQTVLLALAVVLVIAVHVGLAGTVVAQSRWTCVALTAVAALVGVKIALVVWVRVRIRSRKASNTRTTPDKSE